MCGNDPPVVRRCGGSWGIGGLAEETLRSDCRSAYTHVPQRITSDAGPDRITGRWETREQEAMAERIEAQVERFAPGFRRLIGARRILSPTTLQAMDENLHNGAINNGMARIHIKRHGPGRPRTRPLRVVALARSVPTCVIVGIACTIPERVDQIDGRLRRGESLSISTDYGSPTDIAGPVVKVVLLRPGAHPVP